MSKLDEAIDVMKDAIAEAAWAGCEPEERSCQAALAILEAAAKVDKHESMKALSAILLFAASHGINKPNHNIMDAFSLLEALPDEEEK